VGWRDRIIFVAAVLYQRLELIGRTRRPNGDDSCAAVNFRHNPTLLKQNTQQHYKNHPKKLVLFLSFAETVLRARYSVSG
jgi:hypothetical protein